MALCSGETIDSRTKAIFTVKRCNDDNKERFVRFLLARKQNQKKKKSSNFSRKYLSELVISIVVIVRFSREICLLSRSVFRNTSFACAKHVEKCKCREFLGDV